MFVWFFDLYFYIDDVRCKVLIVVIDGLVCIGGVIFVGGCNYVIGYS